MASKKFKLPNNDEVEELFSTVDDTGHSNQERAEKQRLHRLVKGTPREVDPLSETNPAGSDIEKLIRKTAMMFVLITLIIVVLAQVSCGVARRAATANLSEEVSYNTVFQALKGGVEWGDGFTQFPEDFKVIEANQRTHRVEVVVVNTDTDNEMDCFASSNIQATAFSVNALLNPEIDTVVYHVDVHQSKEGKPQRSAVFGFFKPTGDVKRFMTFVWTKHATENGVNFTSSITGVDQALMDKLQERVSMNMTENLFGVSPDKNLYSNKTDNVGDASKVVAIASGIDYAKSYKYSSVEVQSDSEPYGCKVKLAVKNKEENPDLFKQAAQMFALIGNVDQIQYVDDKTDEQIAIYTRSEVDESLKTSSEDKISLETIGSSKESFEEYLNSK